MDDLYKNVSQYFKKHELICKCGCGAYNIDVRLLDLLDKIRIQFGAPVIISSACRCPEWNLKVKGKSKSAHIATEEIVCVAADLFCVASWDRFKLLNIFYDLKIPRIGIASDFIHIDISTQLPNKVIWTY